MPYISIDYAFRRVPSAVPGAHRRAAMSPLRAVLLGLLAQALVSSFARAATITVNSTTDPAGFNPNITLSQLGSTVTLRDAVNAANNTPGDDAIEFDASLSGQRIDLARAGDTSVGASGLRVSSNISITAPSGGITIGRSGSIGTLRLFYVDATGQLALNGVDLWEGVETNGGGIYNQGTVACVRGSFRQNTARNRGYGGGVYNTGTGNFSTSFTLFQGNQAESAGGAFYNDSTSTTPVFFADTNFINNFAIGYVEGGNTFRSNGRAGGLFNAGTVSLARVNFGGNTGNTDGGAIQNTGSGNLTVADSFFELNGKYAGSALVFYGGAIRNYGALTVSGSTFYENNADNRGGAVSSEGGSSNARIVNCTFLRNSANYGAAIAANGGAPVQVLHCTLAQQNSSNYYTVWGESGAVITVTNSILWNPNLIELSTFSANITQSHNIVRGTNPDPQLSYGFIGPAFGLNRNPLPMYGIPLSSPARNAGVVIPGITTDQRGTPRDSLPDIGSYEYIPGPTMVTTASDVTDASDRLTTLREALTYAASQSGPQTVTFDSTLTAGGPITITLGGSELSVNGDITVTGPGAGLATISGNSLSRVFRIAEGRTATLSGLTIANGAVESATFPDGNGGGILNEGSLTLSDCVLSGNVSGGAAYRGDGGALYHHGAALSMVRCTFTGNRTTAAGHGGYGAGIAMDSGTVSISGSTFDGNISDLTENGNGGAICNFGSATTISNSTFTGNQGVNGGAIIHYGNTMSLIHCTIVGNTAKYSGGGIERVGREGNDLTLTTCLIAGNTAPNGPDLYSYTDANPGVFTSQGNNLIGDATGALGFTPGSPASNGDLIGTAAKPIDPRVGPLQDNGGPTKTVALLPGSPAINTGVALAGITTDQRGYPRQASTTGGLLGRYYAVPSGAGTALLSPLSNLEASSPSATVLTPRVDFGSGTESWPGDGTVLDRNSTTGNLFGGLGVSIGTDNIAGLWVGSITVPETASYRFTTRSDDGSVLYVDDHLVVNNNNLQGMTNNSGTVNLTAGKHALRIGYFEATGGAGMQVSWEQLTGAAPFGRQIIAPDWLSFGSTPDIGAYEDPAGNDDPDGDTLSNILELNLGSNPTSIDTDGDGYNDATEMLNGTNPASAASIPPPTHIERVLGYGPARGLDLSGTFPYALNIGAAGAAGKAGDADFTADNVPGVTVSAANDDLNWNNPVFGNTADDHVLEKVYQSIRSSSSQAADPEQRKLKVDLANLVPDRAYKLQLLFGEADATGRRFDIFVNGTLVVNDFAPADAQGGVPMATAGSALVYVFRATSPTVSIVLDGGDVASVPNLNIDPYLNGLTLQLLPIQTPRVLGIAAGLIQATTADIGLNVENGNAAIDISDAVRWARKAAGIDP